MHYIAKTSKMYKKISSSKLNKIHKYVMKQNMANLNYKSKIYNTKHILPYPSFQLFIYLFFVFLKKQTQTTQYGMYECNAMQILKAKRNKNLRQEWSPRILR